MSFIRLLTHSVGLQKREETADEWHGHCGGRLGERIGKGVGAAVSFAVSFPPSTGRMRSLKWDVKNPTEV